MASELRSDTWQHDLLRAGAEALPDPGAVVVRLGADGPQVVSRVYRTEDYRTTRELRRVAVRRSTQLLNGDQEGRNHYVAIRYATGQVVIWTGMHSILVEASQQ
jgi:hypothetical protein